jgi:putative membrane protein
MSITPTRDTKRFNPLAAAWLAGGLFALAATTGCNRTTSEDTTPTAATGTAAQAPDANNGTATGTDTATDANAMAEADDTAGATNADAATADSTAANMGGTSDMATTRTSEVAMASGPITDTQFYTEAMTGDQKEITTGKMVASMSSNANVQKLANRIIADHQAMDAKIKAAAGSMAPAAPAGTVDPAVKGKTGNDLDLAYADAMVADHQKDIPMFENAAKNASSPAARKLASDALPVLREHLKHAQALQTELSSR